MPAMTINHITEQIFTIDDFLDAEACRQFIARSEAVGYQQATVQAGGGRHIVATSVRNNERVIFTSFDLAQSLWLLLEPFAPAQIGKSVAIGLNEMFRFYKYQPGQKFKRHRDQSYMRNAHEASYYTFMIYLNDDYEGGTTTFNNITINPKQGTALVFLHSLEHEGSTVTSGTKYVLRTDVMYRFADE